MGQFHKELRVYAENGLRSAADWMTLARMVQLGEKPKATVTCRGQEYELFTRDQTLHCQSKRVR